MTKILRGIDFVVQSLFIGGVIVVGISTIFTGGVEAIGLAAMYASLVLGPWQLISSLITNIARSPMLKQRRLHLFVSIAYIAGASIAASLSNSVDVGTFLSVVGMIFGFGIPAVLALFYFWITFKTFRSNTVS